MGTLRLLVADGSEIVRKGLCAFVREQPGWELAAEARDGREAVEITKRLKPEVAILDIGMPSLNGLEATRLIAQSGSQTKVLLLTTHNAELLAHQAAAVGAHGYLLKSDTANDLISAVEALRSGRTFFSAIVDKCFLDGSAGRGTPKGRQPDPKPTRLRCSLIAKGKLCSSWRKECSSSRLPLP